MLLDLRVLGLRLCAVGELGVAESTLNSFGIAQDGILVVPMGLSLSSSHKSFCQVLTACVCNQFDALEILEVWVGFDVEIFPRRRQGQAPSDKSRSRWDS